MPSKPYKPFNHDNGMNFVGKPQSGTDWTLYTPPAQAAVKDAKAAAGKATSSSTAAPTAQLPAQTPAGGGVAKGAIQKVMPKLPATTPNIPNLAAILANPPGPAFNGAPQAPALPTNIKPVPMQPVNVNSEGIQRIMAILTGGLQGKVPGWGK